MKLRVQGFVCHRPLADKSSKRKELVERGYDIIGTVGDQRSDIDGPYSGIQVKIPNYLYLIED